MIVGDAQRAVMTLLVRGLITAPEAAKLAGVPRYTICRWIKGKRTAFERTRYLRVALMFRKEIDRGKKLG